jgi:hypothetical protein
MDKKELLERIKTIIYDTPDKLYKYPKPDECWDDTEWADTPSNEKGFILIRELIESEDINRSQEDNKTDKNCDNAKILNLGEGPTFWSQVDEDMFFNAIYSLASYVSIKGEGRNLFLYYRGAMTNEEMCIPKELETVQDN